MRLPRLSTLRLRRFFTRLGAATAVLVVVAVATGWVFVERTRAGLPTPTDLTELRPDYGTRVQTQEGTHLGGQRAVEPVEYADLPPRLVATFLAAEDEDFFRHRGFNLRSIGRAVFENYRAGETVQGASTISQQVAKHFLAPEKTWRRKFREFLLARKIEQEYSKEEILSAYLGGIYFGRGAWGVTQASYTYFARSPRELTVGQMATLAGLLPAPSQFNPIDNPERAVAERNRVLWRMLDIGMLSTDEFEQLQALPLEGPTTADRPVSPAPEAVNTVQRHWDDVGGDREWPTSALEVVTSHHGGLQTLTRQALQRGIERHDRRRGYRGPPASTDNPDEFDERLEDVEPTGRIRPARITEVDPDRGLTLKLPHEVAEISADDLDWVHGLEPDGDDPRSPERDWHTPFAADDIVFAEHRDQTWHLWQPPTFQGAAIITDNYSGEVLASVGAYDVDKSQYHRAEQACRQPGSLFKTILYTEAFSGDVTPATLLSDVPTDVETRDGVWQPRNADRDFSGYLTALDAFVFSRNIPTVNLFEHLGPYRVIDRAEAMGVDSRLAPSPSLALGASCTRPTEMLDVHAAIARGGRAIERRHLVTIHELSTGRLRDHGHFLQRHPGAVARIVRATDRRRGPERVVDPTTNALMTRALDDVTIRGTAADLPNDWPVGAKTGTSNEFDAWFAAFDPGRTSVTWIGSDLQDEAFAPGEHAGTVAVPVFADLYDGLAPDDPDWSPEPGPDADVEDVFIDPATGLRAHPGQRGLTYPFRTGTAPDDYAPTEATRQLERFDATVF